MRALLLALAMALTGCVAADRPPANAAATEQPPVAVTVTRSGADWIAEYRLPRDAPAWPFIRSALTQQGGRSWRTASWRVVTRGVRIERIGRYEALVAERGNVPRTVRIHFTPFTDALEADYVPALGLSDGAVALFDDHFAIFSVASRAAVSALPVDLNGQPIDDSGTRVTFRDRGGPLLHRGARQREVTVQNASSYILFGATRPVETEALAAVIDPALPAWLGASLREMIPAILSRYTADLGPAPAGRPMLLASWAGPTPGRASMNGGVVAGTIIMRFDGDGIVQPDAEIRDIARWFIAHEGAHFWLGQAVRYEASRDAWITEGGADLLAVRTVQAIDPAYDWRRELNGAIRDCARLSRGRGVASAEERGEHRAYYACGAVFALAAEAASGAPFSVFVRQLVDANRGDGVLTRAEWLASVRDPQLRLRIEALLDRGADNPNEAIHQLFRRAGVAHIRDESGLPILR